MSNEQHYITILPSGNASQFPSIDAFLDRLNVKHEKKELRSGGRIYRILAQEIKKPPIDCYTREPYLPVQRASGHSMLLDENDSMWQDFCSE